MKVRSLKYMAFIAHKARTLWSDKYILFISPPGDIVVLASLIILTVYVTLLLLLVNYDCLARRAAQLDAGNLG